MFDDEDDDDDSENGRGEKRTKIWSKSSIKKKSRLVRKFIFI